MSLQQSFENASSRVKSLSAKPDNETLLKLYGLFKQGQSGEVTGKRPGLVNLVARAKYDAWAKLAGMSQEDAQKSYIALVDQLIAKDQK